MIQVNKYHSADPGNRDNSGKKDEKREAEVTTERTSENEPDAEGKSKLEQALQDWSNDDARDRAIDDSSPLRSGL